MNLFVHFLRFNIWFVGSAILLLVPAQLSQADEPSTKGDAIVSVKKVWDWGPHNAFTDLERWHDAWYIVFRESAEHVGGDGVIRVLKSVDGDQWDLEATIEESGVDLRDPKLSVTPGDQLMITMGGSIYDGKTLLGRRPRVSFSSDGFAWTPPIEVLSEGDWLWRTTWHEGKAYGVSYQTSSKNAEGQTPNGKAKPADWNITLFSSADGRAFEPVTQLEVPDRPNETTLRFLSDGRMVAFVRREAGNRMAWIGQSEPPYKDWKWTECDHQVGGPNFIVLDEDRLVASGRSYPGGAKTVVATMTADGDYEPFVTLPSGGDCSYPGMVLHEGLLWLSYYSSHEGKSAIYLAKVKIPQ